MNISERARLKVELAEYIIEPPDEGEFERLRRHFLLPAVLVVGAFWAVTLFCYMLGEAVIWLWGAVFGR